MTEWEAVVQVEGMEKVSMNEAVLVGHHRLLGEVIYIDSGAITVQIFDNPVGLSVGDPVVRTRSPLRMEIGPGMLGSLYDGLQRPLQQKKQEGLPCGLQKRVLSREAKWPFKPSASVGDVLTPGSIYGTVMENVVIEHRLLVPPEEASGRVVFIAQEGFYSLDDVMVELEEEGGMRRRLTMLQRWPLNVPRYVHQLMTMKMMNMYLDREGNRPVEMRINQSEPLVTGKRVIDALFPCPLGGSVGLSGAFGSGKTLLLHSICKHSNADIIVFVGTSSSFPSTLMMMQLIIPMVQHVVHEAAI